ncbi:hypothetical protein F5Y05DRAFT_104984 [Hypoxylon sp. FL0543]|nr:hypothetical protein F5Y05DRAFT_104984 [Hypoxylon sp. FL0543]
MSDRHVKFQVSTPSSKGSPKGRRSRELVHDSGVGSSSSEQASFGGRPDRRFTAEDYEDQLYSVGALQEALGQANKKVEHFQKKCGDLDNELTKAHRVARENDKLYRDECDRNERLERINRELEDLKTAQAVQIEELKAALNEMRDERDEYRQRYLTLANPVIDSTMRGGSGEPSSPRLRRSGSRQDLHQKDSKAPSRRHAEHKEEKPASSRHHRRSSSLSVNPSARSSSRKPYIERMPPSPSTRYSGNYTVGTTDSADPAYYSASPRNPYAATPSTYGVSDIPLTGDYVPYPLYESRGRRRG